MTSDAIVDENSITLASFILSPVSNVVVKHLFDYKLCFVQLVVGRLLFTDSMNVGI